MNKLAMVAAIKIAPARWDEYLKPLQAHARRCLANEPGTLQFEILAPHEEPGTMMLYEVYAGSDEFQAHWNGESMKQGRRDTEGIQASLSGGR